MISPSGHPDYPWKFTESYTVHIKSLRNHKGTLSTTGDGNKVYAILIDDELTIFPGYHFDGCTGAPDFKRAILGCGVHDALIQMLEDNQRAYKRSQADKALLQVQRKSRFALAFLYFAAVLSYGALIGCQSTPPPFSKVPRPTVTMDVYVTDQGFFVITERGSDESMAVRFNVDEIHPADETKEP